MGNAEMILHPFDRTSIPGPRTAELGTRAALIAPERAGGVTIDPPGPFPAGSYQRSR